MDTYNKKESFIYKITLFTPTFNRAYTLDRLYRSVQRQTFRDFEWLIVDDGSTDGTEKLVKCWMQNGNDFPIRYYKQPNGGKCRAINCGLDLAKGELFFVVDSDDYLTDDALDKISLWEEGLPKKELYCGVAGNLGTSSYETVNHLFSAGYYDGTLLDRYRNVDGERAMAFFTDVHRHFPYPEFERETFMTEGIVYNRMANKGYHMRFYNDIICIYKYLPDGLTNSGFDLFLKNPMGYGLFLREKAEFQKYSISQKLRMWYNFYCDMSSYDEKYRLTKKQCAEYIGAPLAAIHAAAIIHALWSTLKGKRKQ